MARDLKEGLYEELITHDLQRELAGREALVVQREPLDKDGAPAVLARHLAREIERVLASVDRDARAPLAAQLLDRLAEAVAEKDRAPTRGQRPIDPPERLLGIYKDAPRVRPQSPMGVSSLFTRAPRSPALSGELQAELASADRLDVIMAFVTVDGLRSLRDALERFAARPGVKLRLLTTAFRSITEPAALDRLAALGADIKVSYLTGRSRLHAKAWLFHRDSGLGTAYIGSANWTRTALTTGHEWVLKCCRADQPFIIEEFLAAFEALWADAEFESYVPGDTALAERFRRARADGRAPDAPLTLVGLHAYPFQEEILDRLRAEREQHQRHCNLVIAATGTGKTVIAALDYKRTIPRPGRPPRLLFVAHRKEILRQARDTFRHALLDGAFGELLCDGEAPERGDHVFASIQLAAGLLDRLGPAHFEHVIIDECHHAPAASYQAVLARLAPRVLVGLTATPERSDGRSLLPDFDGRIAAELRLWSALDRQLLCPFEYFGLADNVDLREVAWTRGGYDRDGLAERYDRNERRARLVLHQLQERVGSLRAVRALGFCVSTAHAEFMAKVFCEAGVPALAVHGETAAEVRAGAGRRLESYEVNVLFTCDLYNEGVDLPFVDTLLLLRPTTSPVLFTQQLGRGLRRYNDKESCLVLDFIGQHRAEYRLDAVYAALTGLPRASVAAAARQGFPVLPSGCTLQLDPVAREVVLRALESSATERRLVQALRELAGGAAVTLTRFLAETDYELGDVYREGRGFARLRRLAGLAAEDSEGERLSEKLRFLLHVDEPARLRAPQPEDRSERDRRRLRMLGYQMNREATIAESEAEAAGLWQRPALARELTELAEVLADREPSSPEVYPESAWPLALHRHYQRREIIAAVGFEKGARYGESREGVIRLEAARAELLLVTLDKSDRRFSPTTRYRDYVLGRTHFHWETQGNARPDNPSGRRYLRGGEEGWRFHLFVRTDKGEPYAYLGPVQYESHYGERPIAITWRLQHPLPAALYDTYELHRPG